MRSRVSQTWEVARLVLENVSKSFVGPRGRKVEAVRGLNLEVREGELLVLAGPSGCGKTTTLRLIAGLERATGGTISMDGKVVNDLPARDRNIAMVFQNLALYPHMTAYENMAFGLKARKLEKAEIERRIQETVGILDLDDCMQRRPSELSGGQRQRVALGRAMVLRPTVLLLDEPLSNLDGPLRARMRGEISALQRRLGVTMVYVTHDQVDAMSLAQRIALMKRGELQQIAEPMALYRDPANVFVAGFLGSPGMNFFRGKVVRKGEGVCFEESSTETPNSELQAELSVKKINPNVADPNTPLKRGVNEMSMFTVEIPKERKTTTSPLVGKDVIMGVRPEDIEIADQERGGTVKARLERVERFGADVYLHASTSVHAFTVRARSEVAAQRDLYVRFDTERACFFDENGSALGSG